MISKIQEVIGRGPVVYPFLLAIYPILFLWSNNLDELSTYSSAWDLLLPMAISAAAALILLGTIGLVLKNWRKAGLIVSLILLLFFSYGHVQQTIADYGKFGYPAHRYMVSVWPIIFILGTILILRLRTDFRFLTNLINIVASVLVLFSLINIIGHEPLSASYDQVADSGEVADSNLGTNINGQDQAGVRPDIYYITMEGYGSAWSLKNHLGYDISSFTDHLKSKGFYVADESYANYSRTDLSLASSLNMEYHDLEDHQPAQGRSVYIGMIEDNRVMRIAKEQGYRIIHLRERYMSKNLLGPDDLYYGCETVGRVALHADGFAGALLHSTAFEVVLQKYAFLAPQQRNLRLCDFSQLAKTKDLDGPKLVFIHLLLPGEDQVLGPNGEKVSAEVSSGRTVQGYLDQVAFTNKMLRQVVGRLMSDPSEPPIIVIQGDHGEWGSGKSHGEYGSGPIDQDGLRGFQGILNAYYLPYGGNENLYPSISPVNTFRVIYNEYFDAGFELLDDRSHYWWGAPHTFRDVTDILTSTSSD